MRAGPGRTAAAAAASVLLAASGLGCGADDGPASEAVAQPVGTTDESSPFAVGHEPAGYRLVQAGRGTIPQNWSSDSFGDDEPVTVLAPAGADPDGPDAVRVSVTGFEGFEGGLDQASNSYTDGSGEHFEVDGQPAIYTPASDQDGDGDGEPDPADLVVVAGDDLAVRVSAAEAEREDLVEVARQVEPAGDHLRAPAVPDPPGDLEVVGSADADVVITLLGAPFLASDTRPAGERAHSAVWATGEPGTAWAPEDGTVAVSTLPGRALDLDAVAASFHGRGYMGPVEVVDREVDGRPGVVVDQGGADAGGGGFAVVRAVVTSTPDGDLLLVVARGSEAVPVDELLAVAASVGPATVAQWDELVARAGGGPGLRPDDGAVELARSTAGGRGWLLQAREDDGTLYMTSISGTGADTRGQYLVDPCLRLDDGSRACPGAGSTTQSSEDVVVVAVRPTALDGGGEFPGFLIVMTPLPAATVRVGSADGPIEVPLLALPGGVRRGAVVVTEAELAFGPTCGGVELLDAAGRPVPCN